MPFNETSRAQVLESGGLYPVPVPFGWHLVGEDGEPAAIPRVDDGAFHKLLARGALLAMESGDSAQLGTMMLRRHSLSGPVTNEFAARYCEAQLNALQSQGLAPTVQVRTISTSTLSAEPCLKLQLLRNHMTDSRAQLHYVLRDRAQNAWELIYLIRREELEASQPLFAEIDGPPPR